MGPASQGRRDVDRYVGSCLVWTGAPLISRTPLSRLAIHTQGAPLILAPRKAKVPPPPPHRSAPAKAPAAPPQPASDTLSVASDESSGHSENSLPRIIKPRKRRKKDRKPPVGAAPEPIPAPESSIKVTHKPYVPLSYDAEPKSSPPPPSPPPPRRPQDDETLSSCQCRYCDPAGQIWDPSFLSPPSFALFPPRTSPEDAPPLGWGDTAAGRTSSFGAIGRPARPVALTAGLEVSTEIVTSANGQRDLEIKFYAASSSSSTSSSPKEPAAWSDDDGERFLGESLWANIHQLRLQPSEE